MPDPRSAADPAPPAAAPGAGPVGLPALDATPDAEAGIVLIGLDADRLLAGLGLAVLADDAGRVAVTVDRLRHGTPLGFAELVAHGAAHWRAVRPALAAACPDPRASASVRQTWDGVARALGGSVLGGAGPATRVHLTACWVRRADVDLAARPARPDPATP